MGAIRSAAMTKALKLILEKGFTAAEAARKTGLTRGAISQTAEYKEMRAKRATTNGREIMEEFSRELPNLSGDSVRVLKDGVTAKINGNVFQKAPQSGADVRVEAVAGLPARRFVHVTGFLDADYVEFKAGEKYGGGVCAGVERESKHYTRDEAEECVRNGAWREVGALSARAADAPSEPSELSEIQLDSILEKWNRESNSRRVLCRLVEAAVLRSFKSRAADALDSQPADFEDRPLKARVLRNELAIIIGCKDGRTGVEKADAVLNWIEKQGQHVFVSASSQPTDGGVRNG